MSRLSKVRADAGPNVPETEGNAMAEKHGPHCLTTTVERASQILGISRGSAYQAARNGELPGVLKIGCRYVVSVAALHKALAMDDEHGNAKVQ